MTDETYSVYFTSSPALGSIQECEGREFDFADACKWFKHHTTNVSANVGWTHRVIIIGNSDDAILAEWKFGEGIVWPKEETKVGDPSQPIQYPAEDES